MGLFWFQVLGQLRRHDLVMLYLILMDQFLEVAGTRAAWLAGGEAAWGVASAQVRSRCSGSMERMQEAARCAGALVWLSWGAAKELRSGRGRRWRPAVLAAVQPVRGSEARCAAANLAFEGGAGGAGLRGKRSSDPGALAPIKGPQGSLEVPGFRLPCYWEIVGVCSFLKVSGEDDPGTLQRRFREGEHIDVCNELWTTKVHSQQCRIQYRALPEAQQTWIGEPVAGQERRDYHDDVVELLGQEFVAGRRKPIWIIPLGSLLKVVGLRRGRRGALETLEEFDAGVRRSIQLGERSEERSVQIFVAYFFERLLFPMQSSQMNCKFVLLLRDLE
ncbi:hypothetical protein Taro_031360 [Colocasia esculenta]|uniref:Uncharacterized protein n=1 Tax=Colocasia esculenta TaxID=4460 RepID=A0A843W680_COLES|nr:hypothetical protein [Colocasia esculenta]